MPLVKRMRSGGRTWLAVGIISVLSAVFVFILDTNRLLEPLELRAYDGMCYLRAGIAPPRTPEHSEVTMVLVDDRTWNDPAFRLPKALWHRFFAQVIMGLADGGAKAIGLDILLPEVVFDDLVPEYSRTWLRALMVARRKGTPVVTGLFQLRDRQLLPDKRYLQILGAENLGLFNLSTDSDDFIRRMRLYFPAADGSKTGLYSITFLLARRQRPDLKLPAETIYIDYDPSPNPFPRHSFAEVYQRAQAGDRDYFRERFQGKVVLVGFTTTLSQDRHATPLYYMPHGEQRRTPGVEILAHTVNTLLRQRFFSETPAGLRLALYLTLALVVAGGTLYSKRMTWPVATPILIVALGGAGLWSFIHYLILPVVGGVFTVIVCQAASFSYRYWVVDREKRHVRGAFSRYLSPQVVAEILENPELLTLGGSRRVMTAFFSDLQGFTSISESMTPEDLVQLLNRYLSRMTRIVLDLGGTLDKFEGDAIMAFWGAPLAQPDHALLACRAALDQQAELAEFRREIAGQDLPVLKVRMGINTGPMIVGNMGSEERFDYTIMGDAVNLASRLEGANKAFGSKIMISRFTYELVADEMEVRELDLLRVKGKEKPIRVYELLARKGELSPQQVEVRDVFTRGLNRYRNRDFSGALSEFQAALQLDGEDGPALTYVERCRTFLEQAPTEDWDGVFTMRTK